MGYQPWQFGGENKIFWGCTVKTKMLAFEG